MGQHRGRAAGRGVLLALALLLAAGPALAQEAQEAQEEAEAETPAARRPSEFRVGLGVDLFAHRRDPNRTTTRVLDLKLVQLLEVGSGEDPEYFKLGILEGPLFRMFTRRKEGVQRELRVLDLRALALVRSKRQSEDRSDLHLLKLPLIGSLFGFERAGPVRHWTVLYLVRFRTQELEEF